MRKTYITAAFVAALIVGWIGSGLLKEESARPAQSVALKNLARQAKNEDRPLSVVRISTSYASEQDRSIRVRGQTKAERTVVVQSQISGLVKARTVNRGDQVVKGDVLCEISIEDRDANLKEATAALSQADLDYQGALQLAAKGLQSDSAVAAAEARVAATQAVVQRRLLEKSKLRIKAPFAGVVEDIHMDVGQFATPGTACATLVDLDPMLLVGEVSEQQLSGLVSGLPVTAQLSDGQNIVGQVRYVSQVANAGTRTYAIEALLPNADGRINSGLTASINIVTGRSKAHRISPALLVLDDEGRTGVRAVSKNNIVELHLVDLLTEGSDGVWVEGLPEVIDLIVVGQQSVIAGEKVEAKQAELDFSEAISQGANLL